MVTTAGFKLFIAARRQVEVVVYRRAGTGVTWRLDLQRAAVAVDPELYFGPGASAVAGLWRCCGHLKKDETFA